MNILTIADCHGRLLSKDLVNHAGLAEGLSDSIPDIALFLGDNNTDDIECIKDWLQINRWNIPLYGVVGNHDSPTILSRCGIDNLHLQEKTINGIRFGGLSGSIRYKESSTAVLYTNEESDALLAEFTYCDVFVSHSNPQFIEFENVDITPEPKNFFEKMKRKFNCKEAVYESRAKPLRSDCHAGLIGIGNYIERQEPVLCLHGHIHERRQETYHNTIIRSCYGIETVTESKVD